ncbi:MAG: polyprenyl synthetase family protein [Bacteriovorax sp.]|jgi:geranylgeranyl pyrophosphate synthase
MSPEQIENTLRAHLEHLLPHHKSKEVYKYAVLPGGKLFRPSLVWSVLADLDQKCFLKSKDSSFSPHALLASAVEFHHSYTLLHDDLPCMDDDTVRRGKPCTHIVFGQWQALLAGDGLLNLSYQLLAKSNHPRTLELIKFFSWALGPKGLIHGQVLDLSVEMTESFENTLRTHELKTARLIQVAMLGSAILCSTKDRSTEKKLWKFSRLLGVNFQLIDDLSELAEATLSEHEIAVNPWLHNPEVTLRTTCRLLGEFNQLAGDLKLKTTNLIVSEYFKKMNSTITLKQAIIEKHLNKKIDLAPVILLIKKFS